MDYQNIAKLFSLKSKTAIITGGTGVLGSSMVRGIAYAGANVVIVGRRKDAAEKLASELIRAGHQAIGRPVQPRLPDRTTRGAGGEFFVGAVADGDDQVGGVEDVVDVAGRGGHQGEVFEFAAGDIVVLPAGTGHQKLLGSDDFLVVGAYPPEGTYNLCRGDNPAERDKSLMMIPKVPLPASDPVLGKNGPLSQLWRRA